VRTNDPHATVLLVRDGVPIADSAGDDATFEPPGGAGVFRIEVGRGTPATWRVPWIVSNPIYVLAAPRTPVPPAPPPVVAASEPVLPAGTRWRAEHAAGSTIALSPDSAESSTAEALAVRLGTDRLASPYAAAVVPAPANLAQFDRLVLEASASRPLRVSVQLRSQAGERWVRSIYLDSTVRSVPVPFDDFRPVDPGAAKRPPLEAIQSVLVVFDLTNARPGASGRIVVHDLRLERLSHVVRPPAGRAPGRRGSDHVLAPGRRALRNGNSSPDIGGFPAPTRRRMRSALGTFPRAPRSAKYSSVRSTASFSATATLMS
jgi:hypothetical protein